MTTNTWDSVQQFLRIAAYNVAGFMAGKGWIGNDQTDVAAGAIIGVATLVWTIYWNRKRPA